jgi:hypothetical protein
MGRRVYESSTNVVTLGTARQDIWLLLASASNGIQIHHTQFTAAGVSTATQVNLNLKRGTATVSVGSGGTTPAKNLVDDGDTKASQSTVRANDSTTQATTSGNFTGYVHYTQWNVLLPFDEMPGPEDEDRPTCSVLEALIWELPAVLTQSYTISQFIKWREVP